MQTVFGQNFRTHNGEQWEVPDFGPFTVLASLLTVLKKVNILCV
jgi:hypothetical protein